MAKVKEACGVAGIIIKNELVSSQNEASYLIYLCLNALQHRGQESCGIASTEENRQFHLFKNMGLASQVFNESLLSKLTGSMALGHTRYSTEVCNAQPLNLEFKLPQSSPEEVNNLTLAHNGNLVNTNQLSILLKGSNQEVVTSSDSELLLHLLNQSLQSKLNSQYLEALKNFQSTKFEEAKKLIHQAFEEALNPAKGSFSLGLMFGSNILAAVRDPNGFRPLCLGALKEDGELRGYVIASESCALDVIGATFVREIEPGEILLIDKNLHMTSSKLQNINPKLCLFELVYFARPDSDINDVQVYAYREALGRRLALDAPIPANADIVVGVPDSGTPAAIGYATQSGIPYANALVKNRYIGRTFIQPTQAIRQMGIRLKLNPLTKVIAGKSVVLIDDSIVRGNTPNQLVKLLKHAGAKEVHLRISSPPIMWGCHYGIAMKNHELIARRLDGDFDRICQQIGADSLAYLPLESLLESTKQNPNSFCTACFSGNYPVELTDLNNETAKELEMLV
jgi:amidophosphoribosyltransferase